MFNIPQLIAFGARSGDAMFHLWFMLRLSVALFCHRYKIPRYLSVIGSSGPEDSHAQGAVGLATDFPMTLSGKVQKYRLRKMVSRAASPDTAPLTVKKMILQHVFCIALNFRFLQIDTYMYPCTMCFATIPRFDRTLATHSRACCCKTALAKRVKLDGPF